MHNPGDMTGRHCDVQELKILYICTYYNSCPTINMSVIGLGLLLCTSLPFTPEANCSHRSAACVWGWDAAHALWRQWTSSHGTQPSVVSSSPALLACMEPGWALSTSSPGWPPHHLGPHVLSLLEKTCILSQFHKPMNACILHEELGHYSYVFCA